MDILISYWNLDPDVEYDPRICDVDRMLFNITGSIDSGREWIRGYNRGLRGVPGELLETEEGLEKVLKYLAMISRSE